MSQIPKGAFLLVSDGPAAGHTVPLKERLIIGRSSQCDLTLSGQLISRLHAEILFKDDHFEVRDLGSANGTCVNGAPVSRAVISDGDLVKVGEATLTIQLGEPEHRPQSLSSQVVMRRSPTLEANHIFMQGQPSTLRTAMLGGDLVKAQRAQERLHALVGISENLARLRQLEVLYPLILDEVMRVVPAHRGALLIMDPDGVTRPRAARNNEQPGGQVDVSQSVVREVVDKGVCIISSDALLDEEIAVSESIMDLDIRAVLCVPIQYEQEVLGVLYTDAPGKDDVFSEEDLHFLSGVGGVAAVAITNARALDQVRSSAVELNRAYLSMLSVMANAIEARDHYTVGHTWRVARFSQAIARRLGWDEKRLAAVEVGGVLHDIGKIGVPDAILSKTAALNDSEFAHMKLHPQIGARMLNDVPSLEYALPYILYHHERYDGRGYPSKLSGKDIPEEARLLGVADCLDAMTSDRPYRKGMPLDVAMAEIQKMAGTQFDPAMVSALVTAHRAGDLTPFLQRGEEDARELICPFCSTSFTPPATSLSEQELICPTCNRRIVLFNEDGYYRATLI